MKRRLSRVTALQTSAQPGSARLPDRGPAWPAQRRPHEREPTRLRRARLFPPPSGPAQRAQLVVPGFVPQRCELRTRPARRGKRRDRWATRAHGRDRGGSRRPRDGQRQIGRVHAGGGGGSPGIRRRQALPAFTTARLEHLPSSWCRHAHAETVRLAPIAFLGLVRPLDGGFSHTDRVPGRLTQPNGTEARAEYSNRISSGTLNRGKRTEVAAGCDAPRLLSLSFGPGVATLAEPRREVRPPHSQVFPFRPRALSSFIHTLCTAVDKSTKINTVRGKVGACVEGFSHR